MENINMTIINKFLHSLELDAHLAARTITLYPKSREAESAVYRIQRNVVRIKEYVKEVSQQNTRQKTVMLNNRRVTK